MFGAIATHLSALRILPGEGGWKRGFMMMCVVFVFGREQPKLPPVATLRPLEKGLQRTLDYLHRVSCFVLCQDVVFVHAKV